jgi:membrane protease YdiL (CAAX protease family)
MIIYALLLFALGALHHLYFGEPLSTLYLNNPSAPYTLGVEAEVAVGALLGLALVVLTRALSGRFEVLRRLDEDFAALFARHHPLHLTGLALMSAFVEEVLFRGWLLPQVGLIWSSLLFGAAHVPLERHHWPWPLAATLMGFVLGGLTLATGNITLAFVVHFTLNHFNLQALREGAARVTP